jgi:TolB protein
MYVRYRRLAHLVLVLVLCIFHSGRAATAGTTQVYLPIVQGIPRPQAKLAFLAADTFSTFTDLYTVQPDGSQLTRIFTSDAVRIGSMVWSPDGAQIALSMDPSFGSEQIYVINADGTGLKQLTFDGESNSFPSWSPDGQYLAYSSNMGAPYPKQGAHLWLMRADGTDRQQLTFNPPGVPSYYNPVDYYPSWSPTGQQIVFVSLARSTRPQIYIINRDGTGLRQLSTPWDANAPQWSPDGSLIALTPDDPPFNIYTMAPDGTQLTQRTYHGEGTMPSWSPNGNWLAVSDRSKISLLYLPTGAVYPFPVTAYRGSTYYYWPAWPRHYRATHA